MEPIRYPQETNTAQIAGINGGKISEIVNWITNHEQDHDASEEIFAKWFEGFEKRLTKLEKVKAPVKRKAKNARTSKA